MFIRILILCLFSFFLKSTIPLLNAKTLVFFVQQKTTKNGKKSLTFLRSTSKNNLLHEELVASQRRGKWGWRSFPSNYRTSGQGTLVVDEVGDTTIEVLSDRVKIHSPGSTPKDVMIDDIPDMDGGQYTLRVEVSDSVSSSPAAKKGPSAKRRELARMMRRVELPERIYDPESAREMRLSMFPVKGSAANAKPQYAKQVEWRSAARTASVIQVGQSAKPQHSKKVVKQKGPVLYAVESQKPIETRVDRHTPALFEAEVWTGREGKDRWLSVWKQDAPGLVYNFRLSKKKRNLSFFPLSDGKVLPTSERNIVYSMKSLEEYKSLHRQFRWTLPKSASVAEETKVSVLRYSLSRKKFDVEIGTHRLDLSDLLKSTP